MKIVHYLNQFFGQIGGEDMADHPLEVRESVIGPGVSISEMLSDKNEIVATIICGDNYFNDNKEEVSKEIKKILEKYNADVVIAGPAFNAGRYGMACGAVCQVAYNAGIKAVSGMYEENPGLELYRKYGFIFPTEKNARGMKNSLAKIVPFVEKLNLEEYSFDYEAEGHFKRGLRKNIWVEKTGAERAVDMILNKINNEEFITELEMPDFSKVVPSDPIEDLSKAKIALITTCGPVPKGNPDRIESHSATKWKIYHLEDFGGREMKNVEIAHGGFTPVFGFENGNRVFPVDAMLQLEEEGVIGSLDRNLYVTVGNSMSVTKAEEFGLEIAQSLKDSGVQGAILTSG